jgi:DNA-binding NtrC family response regulator
MKTIEPPVCVVDDDESVRESLSSLLRSEGIRVETFASAPEFLARQSSEPPACLILDIDLPKLNGLELQRELIRTGQHIPIIFLTGHGDIPMSVRAIRAGAIEFLTKPFEPDELIDAVREGLYARDYAGPSPSEKTTGDIVGSSAGLRAALGQIRIVAPTDSTVLILGETGVGKELIAQEIHRLSRRKDRPLVRVNCASVSKELYESEFFGHVKGAFTGAFKDRAGRFEAAQHGTLFLDEVGEIPLDLQSKLLRALQEKQYERIGDDRTRSADVRIIAATNRDLKREVQAGRFREDLYYRLKVFPLQVPSLRERREDIPLLAKHFVDLVGREMQGPRPRLTEAGVAQLRSYDWPGNIRELRNVVERAVILARGGPLHFDLPATNLPTPPAAPQLHEVPVDAGFLTEWEIQQRDRQNLINVLDRAGWKVTGADGAAALLGMKPTTLFSRIKKLGLKRRDEVALVG